MLATRYHSALRSLSDAEVDFILVGGLAAAIQGAPAATPDIDVVFSVAAENLARILSWMSDADAIFRTRPEHHLRPDKVHLTAGKPLKLITRYGPVDLLTTLGQGFGYCELLANTTEMAVDECLGVRVLKLEAIISFKERLATPKDLAEVAVLRSTLKLLREQKS